MFYILDVPGSDLGSKRSTSAHLRVIFLSTSPGKNSLIS